MTSRLLISLELLLLAMLAAHAQTAEEFFNHGAQFYISNNIPVALEKVEGGRRLYPDDVKLKKLEELLKQKNQQQQQQSQQNQQKQQDQQKQQQQQQSQQNQQQQQNQQAQSQPSQPDKKSGQKENERQAEATTAREMTPDEAQRLLDAQKGNEQFLQLKPNEPPESQNRVVKDW